MRTHSEVVRFDCPYTTVHLGMYSFVIGVELKKGRKSVGFEKRLVAKTHL